MRGLFKTPTSCWDPFVSPVLHFRSAPSNIPEEFHCSSVFHCPDEDTDVENFVPVLEPSREHLRFPPEKIPWIRISYKRGGVIETQSVEMGKLLHENITSYSSASDPRNEAHSRVIVERFDDFRGKDGERRVKYNESFDKKIADFIMEEFKEI